MASLLLNKGKFTRLNHVKPVLLFNQNLQRFSFELLSFPFDEINSLFFRLF